MSSLALSASLIRKLNARLNYHLALLAPVEVAVAGALSG